MESVGKKEEKDVTIEEKEENVTPEKEECDLEAIKKEYKAVTGKNAVGKYAKDCKRMQEKIDAAKAE